VGHVADEIRELDEERILAFVRHSGRGKSSGVEIQAEHVHVIHVRDGKVTRLVAYYERDRALGAVRLPNEQGAR
jgi:ketosteroid isomerase-like protein